LNAREIVVGFNPELPAERAEVPPINGSVCACGGRFPKDNCDGPANEMLWQSASCSMRRAEKARAPTRTAQRAVAKKLRFEIAVGSGIHNNELQAQLGMRESSGRSCEGRDPSVSKVAADTAEPAWFNKSNIGFVIKPPALMGRKLFLQLTRPTAANLRNLK
jgi:hypothetical protein